MLLFTVQSIPTFNLLITPVRTMNTSYSFKEILYSETKGALTLKEVIFHIKSFLEQEETAFYSLVIGTDSHERLENSHGKKLIDLVTAIVIHRKGHGGIYFWKKKKIFNIRTLREKIYAETLESLNFATIFVPAFNTSLNGKSPLFELEIHVDVGTRGETRDMIKEIVGMVNGNGFVAKTKPEAYGASYVADRHT